MTSQYFFEKLLFGWLYRVIFYMREYFWPHTVVIAMKNIYSINKLRKTPKIVEIHTMSSGARKQKGNKWDIHYRLKRPSYEGEHIIRFYKKKWPTHNYGASHLTNNIMLIVGKWHHYFIYKPTGEAPSLG